MKRKAHAGTGLVGYGTGIYDFAVSLLTTPPHKEFFVAPDRYLKRQFAVPHGQIARIPACTAWLAS